MPESAVRVLVAIAEPILAAYVSECLTGCGKYELIPVTAFAAVAPRLGEVAVVLVDLHLPDIQQPVEALRTLCDLLGASGPVVIGLAHQYDLDTVAEVLRDCGQLCVFHDEIDPQRLQNTLSTALAYRRDGKGRFESDDPQVFSQASHLLRRSEKPTGSGPLPSGPIELLLTQIATKTDRVLAQQRQTVENVQKLDDRLYQVEQGAQSHIKTLRASLRRLRALQHFVDGDKREGIKPLNIRLEALETALAESRLRSEQRQALMQGAVVRAAPELLRWLFVLVMGYAAYTLRGELHPDSAPRPAVTSPR